MSAAAIASARATVGMTTSARPRTETATMASTGDVAGGSTRTPPPRRDHVGGPPGDGAGGHLGTSTSRRRHGGDVGRRTRRDEERPEPPGGPPDRGPPGEVDERRRRPDRREPGDRLQPCRVDLQVGIERRHPTANAATVERHADDRADRHRRAQVVGDRVVELLVEPSDVGLHPDRRRRHGPSHPVLGGERSVRRAGAAQFGTWTGGRPDRVAYRPTAALKSSRRLACSHVNCGRLRPKWPYAAVSR